VSARDGAKQAIKRALLAVVGRRLRCELCGEVLAKAAPFVWKGQLVLVGVEQEFVAVEFGSMNRLVFRHAQAGACRRR
jgi:hypothetical protein